MNFDEALKLAQPYGVWNGDTMEFNDVGLTDFVHIVQKKAIGKKGECMMRKSIETAIEYMDLYTMTGLPEDLQKMRKHIYEALDESKIDRTQKLISDVNNMRDAQKSAMQGDEDKYNIGLFNGLEFASAIMERREPIFK